MLANLEADRARVGDLESQILNLERSLSALREEKILVQERLASYKYPVLELPSEIVSEIFMHFLPDYPLFPPLTGLLSPTLLTHICRRWREIALGTPALWSTIKSYHDDRDISLDMHHINTWLNRSRCCPLSLQFGRGDPRLDITQVLKTVVPHRARWEHLDFYLPPSHIPIIDGPMPLLRFLALFLLNSPVVAIEGFEFREVPLLRTVVLNGTAALGVILPWAQLTSLTLLHVYPRVCVPILQQTSNLVRCALVLKFDSHGDGQPGPDIALPYLESLTVDLAGGLITNLLGTFILPALRSLEIPEEFLESNPVASLSGFVSKSGCKLEEVHITGRCSLPQDSYRQAFPSIRKFSFDGENDSSDSFSDIEDNSNSQ